MVSKYHLFLVRSNSILFMFFIVQHAVSGQFLISYHRKRDNIVATHNSMAIWNFNKKYLLVSAVIQF